jgi:putative effector of murein hydrolase LrgA (UPF0299 family)
VLANSVLAVATDPSFDQFFEREQTFKLIISGTVIGAALAGLAGLTILGPIIGMAIIFASLIKLTLAHVGHRSRYQELLA